MFSVQKVRLIAKLMLIKVTSRKSVPVHLQLLQSTMSVQNSLYLVLSFVGIMFSTDQGKHNSHNGPSYLNILCTL